MSGKKRAVMAFLDSLSKTKMNKVKGYILIYERQSMWSIFIKTKHGWHDVFWCNWNPNRAQVKVMYDLFIRGYEEEKNVP